MAEQTTDLPAGRANVFVITLATLMALNLMDRQLLAIVAEPIKHEFNLSDTQLGVLTGAIFAFVFALASVPIAWAADRVNRVGILTVCATLWAICTGAMGAVTGFPQLAMARMGLAIGEAGCNPCAQSLIADYVPPERRARAMATYSMGVPAGFIVAGIAGGLLTDALGWRNMFFLLGAISLLTAFAAAWVLPEPKRAKRAEPQAGEAAPIQAGGYGALMRKRAFQNLVLGSGLGAMASYGGLVWGTVFIVRYFGWTPGQAGAVFGTLGALFAFAGTWFGGWFSDRMLKRDVRWPLWVPALVLVLATPFGMVGAFATAIGVIFVTSSAEAFLRSATLAPAAATLQRLATNDSRARAAATVGVVGTLIGLGLGPTMVGVVSDLVKPMFGDNALRYGLFALAVPQLLAAFFLWRAAQTLERDLAE